MYVVISYKKVKTPPSHTTIPCALGVTILSTLVSGPVFYILIHGNKTI